MAGEFRDDVFMEHLILTEHQLLAAERSPCLVPQTPSVRSHIDSQFHKKLWAGIRYRSVSLQSMNPPLMPASPVLRQNSVRPEINRLHNFLGPSTAISAITGAHEPLPRIVVGPAPPLRSIASKPPPGKSRSPAAAGGAESQASQAPDWSG